MIRVGQRLGKYRIQRRIAVGGFATVYRAQDTIAGVPVALKMPHTSLVTKSTLADFRKEVRLTARLDHPNILPVKDAGFIDNHFVIAYPLGEGTLHERLKRRLTTRAALELADQMLAGAAYAHSKRLMHCDIKPENFIIFPENRVRLADFGIARVAQRTLQASGSGTVGYIAPEQALGKPSFRSDVFSLGLVLYRMLAGVLPEWPYRWPPPGSDRLRRNLQPNFIEFLRRSLEVDHRKRYKDAEQMQRAFRRIRARALKPSAGRRTTQKRSTRTNRDWRTLRRREFLKRYRKELDIRGNCHRCNGPVSETMRACPWCGTKRRIQPEEWRFKAHCPRCKRSLKTDWRFCPWCYGPALNPDANARYNDKRYSARCTNPNCSGMDLMPFMRYCPWCHRKVRRKWKISGVKDKCRHCGWGVLPEYWDHCPWCSRSLGRR